MVEGFGCIGHAKSGWDRFFPDNEVLCKRGPGGLDFPKAQVRSRRSHFSRRPYAGRFICCFNPVSEHPAPEGGLWISNCKSEIIYVLRPSLSHA